MDISDSDSTSIELSPYIRVSTIKGTSRVLYQSVSKKRFNSIYDPSYGAYGEAVIKFRTQKIIEIMPDEMYATVLSRKIDDVNISISASIIVENAELNAFFDMLRPLNAKTKGKPKKHITFILCKDPNEDNMQKIKEVHDELVEYIKTPRRLVLKNMHQRC